jgi:hypothetical protein
MPRKSLASLSVQPVIQPAPVPTPPPHLSEAERELWLQIVLSKDPSWWDAGMMHLLDQLVQRVPGVLPSQTTSGIQS